MICNCGNVGFAGDSLQNGYQSVRLAGRFYTTDRNHNHANCMNAYSMYAGWFYNCFTTPLFGEYVYGDPSCVAANTCPNAKNLAW